jgi:hypothetical protein
MPPLQGWFLVDPQPGARASGYRYAAPDGALSSAEFLVSMNGGDAANRVLVDLDSESQSDL